MAKILKMNLRFNNLSFTENEAAFLTNGCLFNSKAAYV